MEKETLLRVLLGLNNVIKHQRTHTHQDTKYLIYKQISLKQYFIIN